MTVVAWRGSGGLSIEPLALGAARDLSKAHEDHVGFPSALQKVQDQLASIALPLRGGVSAVLDLDELRRGHCRSLQIAGHEIFEICFLREG